MPAAQSPSVLAPVNSTHVTRSPNRAPRSPRREETDDSDKAGRVWARNVADPWWPCMLTLDGGGIRGYSSLLILKALMHQIWLWEKYYDAVDAGEIEDIRTDSPTDMVHDDHFDTKLTAVMAPASTLSPPAVAHTSRGRSVILHELRDGLDEGDGAHAVGMRSETARAAPASAIKVIGQDDTVADSTKRKVVSEEELLPCHYFDFMYGTSTGGLIATILGRLRMTVTEGLELYRSVGDDLFGRRRSRIPLVTKYYHEPLEKAVRDIVGSRCHEHEDCDGNDLHPWDVDHLDEILQRDVPFDVDEPRVCQSCCLTATHDENISEAYLLRSYPHYYGEDAPNWFTRYNEGADPLPIWQVMRATTAAPFYFEMVEAEVADSRKAFKDGGIRENNSSGAALSEFHALYDGKAPTPALMLSVGTGMPNEIHDGFAASWPAPLGRIRIVTKLLEKLAVVQNVLIKYTLGEKQHHQMREYAHGEHTWYKRLNVDKGLGDMPLDDWRKGLWRDPATGVERVVSGGASLTHMEKVTDEYLARPFNAAVDTYAPPSTMLRQAAQKLVLQRRAREAEGGERWNTFVGKNLHSHVRGASVTPTHVS